MGMVRTPILTVAEINIYPRDIKWAHGIYVYLLAA